MPREFYPITLSTGWYDATGASVGVIIHRGRAWAHGVIEGYGVAFSGSEPEWEQIVTHICEPGGIPLAARPASIVTVPLWVFNHPCDLAQRGLIWDTEIHPDGSWLILSRATRPENLRTHAGHIDFVLSQASWDLAATPDNPSWRDVSGRVFTPYWAAGAPAPELGHHGGITHARGRFTLVDDVAGGNKMLNAEASPSPNQPVDPADETSTFHVFAASGSQGSKFHCHAVSSGCELVVYEAVRRPIFVTGRLRTNIYRGEDPVADTLADTGAVTRGVDISSTEMSTAQGIELDWRNNPLITTSSPLGTRVGVVCNVQPNGDHYRIYHTYDDPPDANPDVINMVEKVVGGSVTLIGRRFGFLRQPFTALHTGTEFHVTWRGPSGETVLVRDTSPLPAGGWWGYFSTAGYVPNWVRIAGMRSYYPKEGEDAIMDGAWWPSTFEEDVPEETSLLMVV